MQEFTQAVEYAVIRAALVLALIVVLAPFQNTIGHETIEDNVCIFKMVYTLKKDFHFKIENHFY